MSVRAMILCLLGVASIAGSARKLPADAPLEVSVCHLQANPSAYDHKLIEVTGVVSHAFEEFLLSDEQCAEKPGIWLEYGGSTNSGTMYCCGVTADRKRAKPLVVEGVAVPLVEDGLFRQFDARIQNSDRVVTGATILGRFFAGRKEHVGTGTRWAGFGHLGCCSLLAIQQVLAINSLGGRDGTAGSHPASAEPANNRMEPTRPTRPYAARLIRGR